jgi:drug/metabolite transporter (DMT)-like permease
MRRSDAAALVAMAAMWGASFMFARVLAPAIGWAWTAEARVVVGGGLLAAMMFARREAWHLRRDGGHYLLLGLVNSAIPFALFAIAAQHIPAAYLSVGNATAPLWSAAIGVLLLGDPLGGRRLAGLLLGVAGVALTARAGGLPLDLAVALALGATVLAALLYGVAGAWMKTRARRIEPLALGAATQLAAALWLLPVALAHGLPSALGTPRIALLTVAFGVLCTGLPYLLYFPLMRRIGPTRAMTVNFLVPVFAMAWGLVFLGEPVTPGAIAGCVLVLAGVVLANQTTTPQPDADRNRGSAVR